MARNPSLPTLRELFEVEAGSSGYVFRETGQYVTSEEYHLLAVMINNGRVQFLENLARTFTGKRLDTLQDLYNAQGQVMHLLQGLKEREKLLFGGKYEIQIMKPPSANSMSFWWANFVPKEERRAALRLVHDVDSPDLARDNTLTR